MVNAWVFGIPIIVKVIPKFYIVPTKHVHYMIPHLYLVNNVMSIHSSDYIFKVIPDVCRSVINVIRRESVQPWQACETVFWALCMRSKRNDLARNTFKALKTRTGNDDHLPAAIAKSKLRRCSRSWSSSDCHSVTVRIRKCHRALHIKRLIVYVRLSGLGFWPRHSCCKVSMSAVDAWKILTRTWYTASFI